MNSPPFQIATATPQPTDSLSIYPTAETAFREMIVSALAREHDFLDALQGFSAHHKFGVGTTAARNAITDWVVGSLWINTDSTPVLQYCSAIGPVVFINLGTSPSTQDNLMQVESFLGVF
jgi:hypothetical protein